MKIAYSFILALVLVSQATAGLLPSTGGSEKPLPSTGGGGKVLPSKDSDGKKPLPTSPGSGGGSGGNVLPTPINDAGGGDFFASATRLKGVGDMVQESNNELATKEEGEPNHGNYEGNPGGKSLWWRYQGTKDGTITISTEGSKFDTVLGVYVGDSISSLTPIAADNDGGAGQTSKVTVRVFPNSFYYIAVDGYNGASGKLRLTITFEPMSLSTDGFPINDNFVNRKKLLGARALDYGSNASATVEPNDPNVAEFSSILVGQNVWWQWTAPTDGTVTLSTAGSSYDTTLFVYYDAVDLYKGTGNLRNLALIEWDDEGGDQEESEGNIHTSELKFHAYEGETYYIAVDGYVWTNGRATGDIVLNVDLQPHESVSYILEDDIFSDFVDKYYFYINSKFPYGQVPPLNDAYAFRTGLKGKTIELPSTTAHAHWFENKEPDHGDTGANYYTTWWTWTAPNVGFVRVTATANEDSTLVPVVGLYHGFKLSSLTPVASDVDEDDDGKASVLKQVKKGETLQIAVSGDNFSSGAYVFTLKMSPGKLKIEKQPKSVIATAGQKVLFAVVTAADSLAPITYQWEIKRNGEWVELKNNSNYAGVTTPTLAVLSTSVEQSGVQFRCVLKNEVSEVVSETVKLTVNPASLRGRK